MHFYTKSVMQQINQNGKKKIGFQVIKGDPGEMKKVSGYSTSNDPDKYMIDWNTKKKSPFGKIESMHKSFKIKKENISQLLKGVFLPASSSKNIHMVVKKTIHKPNIQKVAVPKKVALKKVAPKKVALKKVALKKVAPKKVALKKVAPKKVAPTKVAPKKVAPKKVAVQKLTLNTK